MLTRNYWIAKAAVDADKELEVFGDGSTTKPKLITVSGDVGLNVYSNGKYRTIPDPTSSLNVWMGYRRFNNDVSNNITDGTNSSGFSYGTFFGSGNTPPTIDDYKLSGDTIRNCTSSYTENHTYSEDGSASILSVTYTITNNNDAEITIGEVALFAECYWQTAYNAFTHHYYMFERTALEAPITIAPGGVGQITYTIQMNYPVT